MLSASEMQKNYEAGLALARRDFKGTADVQTAAKRIAEALESLSIPYAIAGALAVTAHGHVRVTRDVALLLGPDGQRRFKEAWLGRGWVERFPGSKGMRDSVCKVDVDVLLTGDYPGDGKPKPVRFPDPGEVAISLGGVSTLALPPLIELKLASGLTAPDRPRDFDDVIQLIRANSLPAEFVEELNPYVQAKFGELWGYAQIQRRDE